MAEARILIVDDDSSVRLALGALLKRRTKAVVQEADSFEGAIDILSRQEVAVVLTDLSLGGDKSGLDVLEAARRMWPTVQVVLMSAVANKDAAIRALSLGANSFVEKPFKNEELVLLINNLLRPTDEGARGSRVSRRHNHKGERRDVEAKGGSGAWQELLARVDRAAETEATIVLEGETGTGKGVLARRIHEKSRRRSGALRSINCGALVETLLESQLFGHLKGAFTGAERDQPGLLRATNGGTFFLDEVGEMTSATQVKVLRVLQEREVIPVGGVDAHEIDVRFVAATNRDLETMVREGRFREDLFYRLSVIPIRVPSLRERTEDLPVLVEDIIERMRSRDREMHIEGISEEVWEVFRSYAWPGNVRELENVLAYAGAMTRGVVTFGHLPERLTNLGNGKEKRETGVSIARLDDLNREYVRWVVGRLGAEAASGVLGISLDEVRRLSQG